MSSANAAAKPETGNGRSLLRWREIPPGVWALGLVSLFMDLSSEMIHALFPLYLVTVLGTSVLTVGIIEGIAEATASIVKIFSGALRAKRLLLLTDVPGVLDKSKSLIKQLTADDARRLIADGTVSGGMIPKVETCLYALEQGVEGVVILDGRVPHAVLLELLTDHGAGTLMTR